MNLQKLCARFLVYEVVHFFFKRRFVSLTIFLKGFTTQKLSSRSRFYLKLVLTNKQTLNRYLENGLHSFIHSLIHSFGIYLLLAGSKEVRNREMKEKASVGSSGPYQQPFLGESPTLRLCWLQESAHLSNCPSYPEFPSYPEY